jgi:hypothetical protein
MPDIYNEYGGYTEYGKEQARYHQRVEEERAERERPRKAGTPIRISHDDGAIGYAFSPVLVACIAKAIALAWPPWTYWTFLAGVPAMVVWQVWKKLFMIERPSNGWRLAAALTVAVAAGAIHWMASGGWFDLMWRAVVCYAMAGVLLLIGPRFLRLIPAKGKSSGDPRPTTRAEWRRQSVKSRSSR